MFKSGILYEILFFIFDIQSDFIGKKCFQKLLLRFNNYLTLV